MMQCIGYFNLDYELYLWNYLLSQHFIRGVWRRIDAIGTNIEPGEAIGELGTPYHCCD